MALSTTSYNNLSVEELIQDDFFIESTQAPDHTTEAFWSAFLLQHPHMTENVHAARSLVSNMKFTIELPAAGTRERLWNNILSETKQEAKVIKINGHRKWMWAAAAAVTGIMLISGYWLFTMKTGNPVIHTQFAETKTLVLPDESIVTLNANSSLEYRNDWKEGEPREVWLKGEGFFEVKHLNKEGQPVKDGERFIVHSGNMNVEVLGTSFNVSDRKSVTQVVLQTGKVRVDFDDKKTGSITMVPGELVKYDKQTRQVLKETSDAERFIAWKKKEMVMDNTTVQEVINTIENTFGYKVEVKDKEILSRQLSGTGTISLENQQTLFKSLELILAVDITINDKTLLIKSK